MERCSSVLECSSFHGSLGRWNVCVERENCPRRIWVARPEKTEWVLVWVGALAHTKQGAMDLLAAAAAAAPESSPRSSSKWTYKQRWRPPLLCFRDESRSEPSHRITTVGQAHEWPRTARGRPESFVYTELCSSGTRGRQRSTAPSTEYPSKRRRQSSVTRRPSM